MVPTPGQTKCVTTFSRNKKNAEGLLFQGLGGQACRDIVLPEAEELWSRQPEPLHGLCGGDEGVPLRVARLAPRAQASRQQPAGVRGKPYRCFLDWIVFKKKHEDV